ncbi:MAG: amidohydrolase family protein [Anaerolineae bacterium]|nr:amidohydrolase family protein [Anaerolineae bacterium]
MTIDAHNHPDWHGHNMHRFLQNMKLYNIDRTWLLSWIAPEDEVDPSYRSVMPAAIAPKTGPIPFSLCLKYKEQAPEKFILGFAPDPRRPEAMDELAAAIALYGVQVYGELKLRMMYDNPDAIRMFRFCGEQGLPVTIHIDYEFDRSEKYPRRNYWYGGGMDAFERAIVACPGTNFIGHAPGFWAHISGDGQHDTVPYPKGDVIPGGKVVEMLRGLPNLFADLSAGSAYNALTRDRAFGRDFILEFQDRLLFARDDFNNRMQELLGDFQLPKTAQNKIMFLNAQKLLQH